MSFTHGSQQLTSDKPLVYTAMSKTLFYFRAHISKFVLEQGAVPLNPFMIFEYFLLDTVPRDTVREANNNLVKRADAVWAFGPVSNGVLAELKLAASMGKEIRYFRVEKSMTVVAVDVEHVEMEVEVEAFRAELPVGRM